MRAHLTRTSLPHLSAVYRTWGYAGCFGARASNFPWLVREVREVTPPSAPRHFWLPMKTRAGSAVEHFRKAEHQDERRIVKRNHAEDTECSCG